MPDTAVVNLELTKETATQLGDLIEEYGNRPDSRNWLLALLVQSLQRTQDVGEALDLVKQAMEEQPTPPADEVRHGADLGESTGPLEEMEEEGGGDTVPRAPRIKSMREENIKATYERFRRFLSPQQALTVTAHFWRMSEEEILRILGGRLKSLSYRQKSCVPNKTGQGHHDSETGHPCSPSPGQPGAGESQGTAEAPEKEPKITEQTAEREKKEKRRQQNINRFKKAKEKAKKIAKQKKLAGRIRLALNIGVIVLLAGGMAYLDYLAKRTREERAHDERWREFTGRFREHYQRTRAEVPPEEMQRHVNEGEREKAIRLIREMRKRTVDRGAMPGEEEAFKNKIAAWMEKYGIQESEIGEEDTRSSRRKAWLT